MIDDIWDKKSVYIKGLWGWSPDSWAAIGFTREADRDALVNKTTDPFVMLVYVTQSTPSSYAQHLKGKIVGFYIVSHQKGHRNEFTQANRHNWNPDRWQYALRTLKAYKFLPEYLIDVYEFDPSLKIGAQGKASRGIELTHSQIEKLKLLPYVEVPIYNPEYGFSVIFDDEVQSPKTRVRGGPVNRSGYIVDGEPIDTEKELYALILNGGAPYFLSQELKDHRIYKIGLSISPETRLSLFKKTFPKTWPEGKMEWDLYRSTRRDGYEPYPNFEAAIKGEDAMKDYLGKVSKYLGGEFYAATDKQFEKAWEIGRKAALKYIEDKELKKIDVI